MGNHDTEVHDSTGNVFEDLGLANPEERLAKAELARVMRKMVKERALTPREAKRPDAAERQESR